MAEIITIIEAIQKPNGWYEAKTQDGRKISAQKPELGNVMLGCNGQQVQVELETRVVQKDDRTYTNHYVQSIVPYANGSTAAPPQQVVQTAQQFPAVGTIPQQPAQVAYQQPAPQPEQSKSQWTKDADHPTTRRAIAASVAIQHAYAGMSHTLNSGMTASDVWGKVGPLAEAHYLFIMDKTNTDVPF